MLSSCRSRFNSGVRLVFGRLNHSGSVSAVCASQHGSWAELKEDERKCGAQSNYDKIRSSHECGPEIQNGAGIASSFVI
jgi:hypothetical protein